MRPVALGLTATASALVLALGATACEDEGSQGKEDKIRQGAYDKLTKRQPAANMDYSPTRETIKRWIKTWERPGKLSYVYLQNARGEYGYFVLKGLPVSYCAMLTPNYQIKKKEGGGIVAVPAPGMDGAYYSGQQCNSYYGTDATTGSYVEFTVGTNQSYFLYDRPMEMPEFKGAKPMGPSSIKDVKNGER